MSPLTPFPGKSYDIGSALAHHLGDVERTVGLIGYGDRAIDCLGLHLQTHRARFMVTALALWQPRSQLLGSQVSVLPPLDGWAHDLQGQWCPALEYVSAPVTSTWKNITIFHRKQCACSRDFTNLPLQWCLHSQHAPAQWPRGLWSHWTPRRSDRKQTRSSAHGSVICAEDTQQARAETCDLTGNPEKSPLIWTRGKEAYLRVRKLENILISQIDQERVDTWR